MSIPSSSPGRGQIASYAMILHRRREVRCGAGGKVTAGILLPTFPGKLQDFEEPARDSFVNFEEIDKLNLLGVLLGPDEGIS